MTARRGSGLTLVEVLCATVVVGAGLAVAAAALSTSLRAESHAQASSRAARCLDLLLARVEGGVIPIQGVEGDAQGTFAADGMEEVSWSISVVPTDHEGLVEVVLTVRWNDRGEELYESVSRWLLLPDESAAGEGGG